MTRKKYKRKKRHNEPEILSAADIRSYIEAKYESTNDEFWNWFFSECEWGDTNLLSLNKRDENEIDSKFKEYFKILRDDYRGSVNNDLCLEIKNDL